MNSRFRFVLFTMTSAIAQGMNAVGGHGTRWIPRKSPQHWRESQGAMKIPAELLYVAAISVSQTAEAELGVNTPGGDQLNGSGQSENSTPAAE